MRIPAHERTHTTTLTPTHARIADMRPSIHALARFIALAPPVIRALMQAAEHGNARACVSLARAKLSDGSAGGCVPNLRLRETQRKPGAQQQHAREWRTRARTDASVLLCCTHGARTGARQPAEQCCRTAAAPTTSARRLGLGSGVACASVGCSIAAHAFAV